MPTLMTLTSHIPLVIFHCNSSKGRGPRAAGWYADALEDDLRSRSAGGIEDLNKMVSQRVAVLEGGIKAWEVEFGQGSLDERGKKQGGDGNDSWKTIQL
jgi:arsenical-resistance protein 2